jgi:hypothetical protein
LVFGGIDSPEATERELRAALGFAMIPLFKIKGDGDDVDIDDVDDDGTLPTDILGFKELDENDDVDINVLDVIDVLDSSPLLFPSLYIPPSTLLFFFIFSCFFQPIPFP